MTTHYTGHVKHLTHYEKLPSTPMAIQGWARLIEKLGGSYTLEQVEDGLIDLTVTIHDPRDGSILNTENWTLSPEED